MKSSTRALDRIRAVVVAFALTISAFVGSTLCSMIFLFPLFAMGYGFESTLVTIISFIVTPVGFILVGYLFVRRYGIIINTSKLTRRSIVYTVGGVITALVVAAGTSYAVTILDLQPDAVLEELAVTNPTILLILAVLSVVLIGPAEEFMFRGVVQGRLRESFGPLASVIVASLLFGSMHLFNYSGSVPEMVAGSAVIVCVSLVFGALYEVSGSLLIPSVVHGLYNAILMVAAYLTL